MEGVESRAGDQSRRVLNPQLTDGVKAVGEHDALLRALDYQFCFDSNG